MKFPSTMPPPPKMTNGHTPQSQQDGTQNLSRDSGRREETGGRRFPDFPSFPNTGVVAPSNAQNSNVTTPQQAKVSRFNLEQPPLQPINELKTELVSPLKPIQEDIRMNISETAGKPSFSDKQAHLGIIESKVDHQEGQEKEDKANFNVKQTITDSSSQGQDEKGSGKSSIYKNEKEDLERKNRDKHHSSNRKHKHRKRSRSSRKSSHSKHRKRSHHNKHRDRDSHYKRRSTTGKHKRRYDDFYYQNDERLYSRRHSSSDSGSGSSSSGSSRSSSQDKKNKNKAKQFNKPKIETVHPYFQRKGAAEEVEEAPKLFWDGFQWVARSQPVFDLASNAAQASKEITGENQKQNEERIAASKTVIIENIALDLGLTAKDIQTFLLDQLTAIGVKDVDIVDIDMNNGPTSIAVELQDKAMVDLLQKLDGVVCLGEKLKVRKVNEETAQTNAQAAAITLAALKSLTSGSNESELNLRAGTLKTVNVSPVIKVSNVFDREEEMTPEMYEDLYEDMEDEFKKIPHLKRIKVVRNGEERLGAEVGCAFVEFRDKKSAELGLKALKGRIYDGREIHVSFIDEQLYYNELYIK